MYRGTYVKLTVIKVGLRNMTTMRQTDEFRAAEQRERALLESIVQHDRDALGELYQVYQPRLFKFIFRLIRDYDIVDELVNDVMLVVWRSAAKFRGESRVSTWIFGIAYRQAMRRLSRKRLDLVTEMDLDKFSGPVRTDIENEDWVRAGIDALPAAQQAVVVLVFYNGLSYAEAAAVTDCPVNTIKTRMFHARRKLRDLLIQAAQPDSGARETRNETDH